MKEKIICAAIHLNDGNIYQYQPKNITSGIVIAGRRHHNCFLTLFQHPEIHKQHIDWLLFSEDLY